MFEDGFEGSWEVARLILSSIPIGASATGAASRPLTSSGRDNGDGASEAGDEDVEDAVLGLGGGVGAPTFDPDVKVRGNKLVGAAYPVPKQPSFSSGDAVSRKLLGIQNYLESLGYNYLSAPFFKIRKNLPFKQLMGTAAEMVRYGLPIKCLEAAVVGISLSFKSKAEGSVFRHIVLAIRHHEYYGALGLSRRKDLMFKPLVYRSLRELVMEYKRAYGNNFHELTKIKIGLPCPHDPANHELLPWKFKSVVMDGDTWSRELDEIDYLVQKRRKA